MPNDRNAREQEPAWTPLLRELAAIAQTGSGLCPRPVRSRALRAIGRAGDEADRRADPDRSPGDRGPAARPAGIPGPRSISAPGCSATARTCWCAKSRTGSGPARQALPMSIIRQPRRSETEIEQEIGLHRARDQARGIARPAAASPGASAAALIAARRSSWPRSRVGPPRPSLETTAVDFFAEDALPPLSTGRVTAPLIARLYAHWRDAGSCGQIRLSAIMRYRPLARRPVSP